MLSFVIVISLQWRGLFKNDRVNYVSIQLISTKVQSKIALAHSVPSSPISHYFSSFSGTDSSVSFCAGLNSFPLHTAVREQKKGKKERKTQVKAKKGPSNPDPRWQSKHTTFDPNRFHTSFYPHPPIEKCQLELGMNKRQQHRSTY